MTGTSAVSTSADLLERDDDVVRLEAALRSAREGTGALVLIEGSAGIGKTELVLAARRRAEAAGMTVASARGSELEQELAFGIVRQLLEPFVAEAGVAAEAESRRELFAGAAELAQPLFQPAALAELELAFDRPSNHTFSVLHGLYWLCSNLARRAPLLLAIDDAHWADVASLRFLSYLGRRLEGMPLALLIASRPTSGMTADEFLARLGSDPLAATVSPAPLSAEGVAALVGAAWDQDPDPGFAAACHQATGGIPLLVRELVRELRERGVEPVAAAADAVEGVGPRTVARHVVARVRRLAPEAEGIARAIAVLGSDAELHRVAKLAEVEDEAGLSATLDALALAGIIAPGRPLEFVHPIVRAAIYEELPPAERSRLHTRAAGMLEAERVDDDHVAGHLLAAAPAGDQHVVDILRRAARAASARGAPGSAAAYLERAIAEPPDAGARCSLLHELGVMELHAGRIGAASDHLREATELAEPGRQRAIIVQDLGGALRLVWKHEEAAVAIAQALEHLGPDEADLALALRADLLLLATLEPNAYRDAPMEPEEVPDRRQREHLGTAKYLAALITAAVVLLRRPAAEARELAAASRDAGIVGDLAHGGSHWINAVAPLILADGFTLAEEMLDEAFEASRGKASWIYTSRAYVTRSLLRLRQGSLSEAEADAETALGTATEGGFLYFALLSLSVLVELHCERGELDAAEEALRRMEMDGEIPDTFIDNWVLAARGRLRLAQGRVDDAIADFEKLARNDEQRGHINPAVHAYRSRLALALSRTGDSDRARRLTEEELELARRFGAPRTIGVSLRATGMCREEDGIALLRESVEVLEGSGALLEYGHSLVELGAALRRSGSRADAREPLRAGMELAHSCGANALLERAQEELRATGARPRRIMRTGVEALTPSELRVARMATDGLTNREIAQALFVTQRTVETHLTHAFQKLDISSRGELGSRLSEAATT